LFSLYSFLKASIHIIVTITLATMTNEITRKTNKNGA